MEVSAEAKRVMVVALGKLYSSRTQRGGLRLHRSLLLTLVMKSARDIYHAAQTEESVSSACEDMDSEVEMSSDPKESLQRSSRLSGKTRKSAWDQEELCHGGAPQQTRKRRGNADVEPDFLPCKKAKLEHEQHIVTSVLVDYVNCGSELGPPPTPIPLQTAVAAC